VCHGIRRCSILGLLLAIASNIASAASPTDESSTALRRAVTFYASFDNSTTADFGGGDLTLWTRYGDVAKGQTEVRQGFDQQRIRIAPDQGVSGGALEFLDVVPNYGFVFYPARGKLAIKPGGWGGAMSMWLKCDLAGLKSEYCDPMQIVAKRYNNGAVWTDFTPDRPRDLRLGLFPTVPAGRIPPVKAESLQPIARAKAPPIRPRTWHNLVLVWKSFDTGRADGSAILYLDGAKIAKLDHKDATMKWDLAEPRIFLGAALIGLIDEVAIFGRPLESSEIKQLFKNGAILSGLK